MKSSISTETGKAVGKSMSNDHIDAEMRRGIWAIGPVDWAKAGVQPLQFILIKF